MPLYDFYCEKCGVTEEIISSHPETLTHSCGTEMVRRFAIPCVMVRHTGKQMALDSLNSKETAYMKPEHKQEAFKGTLKKDKVLF